MKDSEADIAIGVLNKLIDQELEAVRAATRDGNTPLRRLRPDPTQRLPLRQGRDQEGARRSRGGKGCGESVPAAA